MYLSDQPESQITEYNSYCTALLQQYAPLTYMHDKSLPISALNVWSLPVHRESQVCTEAAEVGVEAILSGRAAWRFCISYFL